jgi:hypothetical protein
MARSNIIAGTRFRRRSLIKLTAAQRDVLTVDRSITIDSRVAYRVHGPALR